MEIQFPDIPLYEGWGAPLRTESHIRGLELISGKLPEGLEGTWYRAGPDRQYPPMTGDDIFIDGEGMTHMFRFEDGHVEYRSRWVRTERYELQDAARRSLFGRYRNRYTNDPSVAGAHMGTANTNAVLHAGRLLALKEDDLPYELDPDTLETLGRFDYGGQIKAASLSAHPKLDPATGRLVTFSYQARGDATTDVVFYEIDETGKVVDEIWFNMPYPACVHDFAVTEHYAVFPFFPLITDMENLKRGGTFYQWCPDQETHVAIVPRHGKAEGARWFKGPALSAGHMLNAFEEGQSVHLDLCLYDGNCFPFFPTPAGETTEAVPPMLTRMSFDLARNEDSFERRLITPVPGEMPRTDDRFQGRPYRHGYLIMRSQDGLSGIGHVDTTTGALKIWRPGPAAAVQEPQFVPRTPNSPEADGWLLVLVNRLEENRSDLAVLDALNIEAGPVALFKVPVRVRSTFHGTWVAA
jgi:carotenoid cleavage dioxygenase-like enzyme